MAATLNGGGGFLFCCKSVPVKAATVNGGGSLSCCRICCFTSILCSPYSVAGSVDTVQWIWELMDWSNDIIDKKFVGLWTYFMAYAE
ncbi:hypothetical protein A2U01_0059954, partial [Trifolium medium]|nr:hypothetical protein [Trifolium medium]